VRPARDTAAGTDLRREHTRRAAAVSAVGRVHACARAAWPPPPPSGEAAYDHKAIRAEVHRRGIRVRIARKGVESSERLGRHRWIVESCLSWFMNNRRLARRYERKAEHFQAFADLAAILICHRRLTKITK
jgi:hypothetical protein